MGEIRKFAADATLRRLARWLRLLGADVVCPSGTSASDLLREARKTGRVLLTRDKRLRTAPDVVYIESNYFRDQLRQVLSRFPFDPRLRAFTRCSRCNRLLHEVPRNVVSRRVPAFVYASYERFAECDECGRIYWGATHPRRILSELERLGL